MIVSSTVPNSFITCADANTRIWYMHTWNYLAHIALPELLAVNPHAVAEEREWDCRWVSYILCNHVLCVYVCSCHVCDCVTCVSVCVCICVNCLYAYEAPFEGEKDQLDNRLTVLLQVRFCDE
jgi:hypothetical protein